MELVASPLGRSAPSRSVQGTIGTMVRMCTCAPAGVPNCGCSAASHDWPPPYDAPSTATAAGSTCDAKASTTCAIRLRRSRTSTSRSARFTCPQDLPNPRAEYRRTAYRGSRCSSLSSQLESLCLLPPYPCRFTTSGKGATPPGIFRVTSSAVPSTSLARKPEHSIGATVALQVRPRVVAVPVKTPVRVVSRPNAWCGGSGSSASSGKDLRAASKLLSANHRRMADLGCLLPSYARGQAHATRHALRMQGACDNAPSLDGKETPMSVARRWSFPLLLVLIAAGCKDQGAQAPASGTGGSTAAPAGGGGATIGAALRLTGPAASYGALQRAGIQAALEEVNAGGGPKLNVLIEDDASTKEQGITVFQKFI